MQAERQNKANTPLAKETKKEVAKSKVVMKPSTIQQSLSTLNFLSLFLCVRVFVCLSVCFSTYVLAKCDIGQHVMVTHQARISISLDVRKPVAVIMDRAQEEEEEEEESEDRVV